MPFLKMKTLYLTSSLIAATSLVTAACAAANPPADAQVDIKTDLMAAEVEQVEPAPSEPESFGPFGGTDLNSDGVLDLSEFTLYAGDQAVAGRADYIEIVSEGDYAAAFKALDVNGDGVLDADEVQSSDEEDADEGVADEVQPSDEGSSDK